MPETELHPSLHAATLKGAADAPDDRGRDLNTAAFLLLRLVDLFAESETTAAISYQIDATAARLDGLLPAADAAPFDGALLVARDTLESGDYSLLWEPLLELGVQFERSLMLEVALDVFDTALRLPDSGSGRARMMARRGRVLRLAGNLSESLEAYDAAARLAAELGDDEAALNARSGSGMTLVRKGNLPEAERVLSEVIDDCHRLGLRVVEATTYHNLAMARSAREDYSGAIVALHAAYNLHEEERPRLRVVSDLGMTFKDIGWLDAASDCLEIFLAGNPDETSRLNAELELLELAARKSDRAGFEHWKRKIGTKRLPPDARVDFLIKIALGLDRFGEWKRALETLATAVEQAEAHQLNAYMFRAEAEATRIERREAPPRSPAFGEPAQPEIRAVANDIGRVRAAMSA